MPWSKKTDHEDCDGIAVVKDSTGEVEGCHDTEDEADDQIAALNASEERADASGLSKGTLVTWGPSNATRYGEVAEVHTDGEVTSDSGAEDETTMEASEDNPVVERPGETRVPERRKRWLAHRRHCPRGVATPGLRVRHDRVLHRERAHRHGRAR